MTSVGTRSILAYGFRPFFLCGAIWAMLAPLPWVGALFGLWPQTLMALPAAHWHGHELLFGAFGAALAGFLLTALPSWTGTAAVTGRPLAGLAALWMAGRALNLFGGALPDVLLMLVDGAFLPCLVVVALRTTAGHRPPVDLLITVGLLALCPLAAHLAVAGHLPIAPDQPIRLAAGLYLVLIAVTLRHILPVVATFAQSHVGGPPYRPRAGREALAILSLALFVVADTLTPSHPVTGWLALGAAAAQLERMADWPSARAWKHGPIGFLILVQLWLVVGLALRAWTGLVDDLPPYTGRHALLIGTMATAVLAVFSIAGLRHTGRALSVPGHAVAAAVLITGAAILRTAVPLWLPGEYLRLGAGAAVLFWSVAWALWLVRYGPWLCQPRADGLPG